MGAAVLAPVAVAPMSRNTLLLRPLCGITVPEGARHVAVHDHRRQGRISSDAEPQEEP